MNTWSLDTNILIVDDSIAMLALLQKELRSMGFNNVERASGGDKAIECLLNAQAQGRRYDLIISDWNMPGTNGLGVLNFVRKSSVYPDTPFVLLTAETERRLVLEALQAGANGYLLKPFNRASIETAFNSLAARLATRDTNR